MFRSRTPVHRLTATSHPVPEVSNPPQLAPGMASYGTVWYGIDTENETARPHEDAKLTSPSPSHRVEYRDTQQNRRNDDITVDPHPKPRGLRRTDANTGVTFHKRCHHQYGSGWVRSNKAIEL